MQQRTTRSKNTAFTGLVAAAVAVGTFATAGLGSAPAAKADCASFFGIGNSANCQSNLTSIAIAIGPNATAIASGLFGYAIAVGAAAAVGDAGSAKATTAGAFTYAVAVGDKVASKAEGLIGVALAENQVIPTDADAPAVSDAPVQTTEVSGIYNEAISITGSKGDAVTPTVASGVLNIILNSTTALNPGDSVTAKGFDNWVFNELGGDVDLQAGGTPFAFGNTVVNIGSTGTVQAGPGPLAFAVALFNLFGQTIQTGPGLKTSILNGQGGGVAPARSLKTAAHSAATVLGPSKAAPNFTAKKPHAAASATKHVRKIG